MKEEKNKKHNNSNNNNNNNKPHRVNAMLSRHMRVSKVPTKWQIVIAIVNSFNEFQSVQQSWVPLRIAGKMNEQTTETANANEWASERANERELENEKSREKRQAIGTKWC